jgi:D-3-phosphoglycerate dehydrogenase
MRVIAYDPFLSKERAEMGVEKVELDELLKRADFITLHADDRQDPQHPDAEALAKTKKGVRIINCARGGLVDEAALPKRSSQVTSPARASTCSRPSPPPRARCSV